MLEELMALHARQLDHIKSPFKRYLYHRINWDYRLIIITGPRGTGKTFMVLQHFLERYGDIKECLYVSADNPLVLKQGIYATGAEFFKYGGRCLIVDEAHKQKDWSVDIKALFDGYPDKKLIVLGSSTLNILAEKGDLSRRAMPYSLAPLSFREYLELVRGEALASVSVQDLLEGHVKIAGDVSSRFQSVLGDFQSFLERGSFPFFLDFEGADYYRMLDNVLDKVIYEDIQTLKSLKSFSSVKIKKLLGFIATSKIPLFNIEALKREIEVSKETLYEYFDLLDRAGIVSVTRTESKNLRAFKNSKVLFKSPNIYFSIAHELWRADPLKGNIRESFLVSQIPGELPLYSSAEPDVDFILSDGANRVLIEVGGKNKKMKKGHKERNVYIFKDGIECGFGTTIPLFLAGFLY